MTHKLEVLKKLDLHLLEGTYEPVQEISSGKSSWAFYGIDRETNAAVFIKFLLFPRNEIEKARFENEVFILNYALSSRISSLPKILCDGSAEFGNVFYLVTERVDGLTLASWMDEFLICTDIGKRLEIFHRIASSVSRSYVPLFAEHRDLHPGNIILQEGEINWYELYSKDFFVKIIDWGQAYSRLLPMYEDSPDFSFVLYKNIGREFTASFYSAPPEVFSKPLGQQLINYDSWALGLLLYKILTNKDAFIFEGMGDYISAVTDGRIEVIARACKAILEQLDTPHAALLSEVFYRLIKVSPYERMNVQTIERVMWDLRIENFVPRDCHELHNYLLNPFDYEPAEGWRFSSRLEYD